LLVVGGADTEVLALNRDAASRMTCRVELVVVPGATHLLEEPGALEAVIEHAQGWFLENLSPPGDPPESVTRFANRSEAGRQLATALESHRLDRPIVLALPRGGVPVAFEIAKALDAPLDIAFVRKIGAPGHPEFGIGAVVDGRKPEMILNEAVVRALRPSPSYVEAEMARQLAEIERRRRLYRIEPKDLAGRDVIVVDDGIATGGTIHAVLRAVRRQKPARVIAAVPVAPADALPQLSEHADDVVCLLAPEDFGAVGVYYDDFRQTSDDEVIDLIRRASAFGRRPPARVDVASQT
jgi:predicted phosphoribosyltransferase